MLFISGVNMEKLLYNVFSIMLLASTIYGSKLPDSSFQKQQVYQMHQEPNIRINLTQVSCDVIIAGGSTASLGAAIASARRNPDVTICLTEPTDWLGGQMTSSGVSAIDFGNYNKKAEFQSAAFAEMMNSLGGEENPGRCWVSIKCYLPRDLVEGWIHKTVTALPNLKIYYNTVIKSVDKLERMIISVEAIRRTINPPFHPWTTRLSDELPDWYSTDESEYYSKEIINFIPKFPRQYPIVIEATEYGDVLALSEASYRIGVESPEEESNTTIENCGQCVTFPFFMIAYNTTAPKQDVPNPGGSYSFTGESWGRIWAYRRAVGLNIGEQDELHLGEISQQNWGNGNDLCDGYIYLNKTETTKQLNDWQGGINLTSLRAVEDRGWGWYNFYKGNLSEELQSHMYLGLSDVIGTTTGLSKVPYLRDSRRSIGLDGFLFTKKDQLTPAVNNNDLKSGINFSIKFHDSIAIGSYMSDIHKMNKCKWPRYTDDKSILPFHIPFRALTNQDFDNLLVAGKSMAQTEAGNAPSRMHPTEFLTGEAAGTASIMMLEQQLTTRQLYDQIKELQDELVKFMPIYWDQPRNVTRTA
ncbi:hypothetical protein SNE40_020321 [Patella caerulea]|uniref:FAD dependent oxidoreductase n=1 Tax=Patella caerulea TaxID=87958 RepID=A0AAN8GDX7_PATCE